MSTLRITRGIPASGKSTDAKAWVAARPDERARVNRDDLRAMLYGTAAGERLTFAEESDISRAQHRIVKTLLDGGRDVVVDDTNLRDKWLRQWYTVAAGHDIDIVDFPITLDEALRRDAQRKDSVGEAVIRTFHARFTHKGALRPAPAVTSTPAARFERYVPNDDLPAAYVFDVDGTLAHIIDGGRSPYDMTRVGEDTPDRTIASILHALRVTGARIVVVSGRNECAREDTIDWFERHGLHLDALFMRADGDDRGDDVVKYEILKQDIETHYNVQAVFDDRARVVGMWRTVGLKCLQVQPGDF